MRDSYLSVIEYQWITGMFARRGIVLTAALITQLVVRELASRFGCGSIHGIAGLIFPGTLCVLLVHLGLNFWQARRYYATGVKLKQKGVFCFDDTGNKCVWYANSQRVGEQFNKWEKYKCLYETKRFLFLKPLHGQAEVITKRSIPEDDVDAVRQLLLNTPVKKKRLLKH